MVARVTHVKVDPTSPSPCASAGGSVVPAAEQEEAFMGALLLKRE
jgi:hypothetical protein